MREGKCMYNRTVYFEHVFDSAMQGSLIGLKLDQENSFAKSSKIGYGRGKKLQIFKNAAS